MAKHRPAVGDEVARGSPIGTLQLPGSHCFPRACLHWGWIEGASTYLDPLRLVGAGPVRLLPLWRDAPAGSTPATGPAQLAVLPVLAVPPVLPVPLDLFGFDWARPALRPGGAPAGRRGAAGRS